MAPLNVGTLVWAKMKGFPAWPGRIVKPNQALLKIPRAEQSKCIFFFGSHDLAWVESEHVNPYHENKAKMLKLGISKSPAGVSFVKAVKEIERLKEAEGEIFTTPADQAATQETTIQTETKIQETTWNVSDLCDFSVKCRDGTVIGVHKAILGLRCPSLQRALVDLNLQQNRQLKFIDADSKAVREAIRYIYTSKLEEIDGIESDVLDIASKLGVVGLAEACFKKIQDNVTTATVVDRLIFAQSNKRHEVSQEFMKFIIGNFKEVREGETWKKLADYPELLMEIFNNVKTMT